MLNVVMLSVVMLNVDMLNVAAPRHLSSEGVSLKGYITMSKIFHCGPNKSIKISPAFFHERHANGLNEFYALGQCDKVFNSRN
jgi:hypothetical protein